jgi:hypothetical protein
MSSRRPKILRAQNGSAQGPSYPQVTFVTLRHASPAARFTSSEVATRHTSEQLSLGGTTA